MEDTTENTYNVKPASYKWWKDPKMLGTILLISTIIIVIFSFVQVPFISSINGYTFGMLFGFYSPLFYLFIIYKACLMLFDGKVKIPKWVKVTNLTYWFVAISIIFISTSSGYYQTKDSFTEIGLKPWNTFNNWFKNFTNSPSAWTPNSLTNGGITGAFLYSITAMISSGIGSLILSILALVTSVSLLVTGTAFGLYKDLTEKKEKELESKEITKEIKINKESKKIKEQAQESDDSSINQNNNNAFSPEELFKKEDTPQERENNNKKPLPFDDPF